MLLPRLLVSQRNVVLRDEPPGTVEEAVHALHPVGVPGLHLLQRAHEHEVETEGVCSDVGDDVIRVDHVAPALGHLDSPAEDADLGLVLEDKRFSLLDQLALVDTASLHLRSCLLVLRPLLPILVHFLSRDSLVRPCLVEHRVLDGAEDQPLVHQSLEGLLSVYDPAVVEDLVPEPGVQQMKHGMLGPSEVQVNRHPVLLQGRVDGSTRVLRIEEAEVVPAGAGPLRHRIGLPPHLPPVRQLVVHPAVDGGQRSLRGTAGLVGLDVRESDRELRLGEGMGGAVLGKDDGKGLPPVPLTREEPVSQLVVHLPLA
mmetsp:Transcript_10010/g.33365  ORF Transcript_10010/g.33365 Transcript_10010/m.33365 type:complete len:313 (-) Transcript_10010:1839-2777(-)